MDYDFNTINPTFDVWKAKFGSQSNVIKYRSANYLQNEVPECQFSQHTIENCTEFQVTWTDNNWEQLSKTSNFPLSHED